MRNNRIEEERIANLELCFIRRRVDDYCPRRHQSKRLKVVRFGPALNNGPMSTYQGNTKTIVGAASSTRANSVPLINAEES
jgi:hypothetical protein